MPTLEEIAAMTSLPVLTVRVPGQTEQAYIVREGMTIGRATHNAIVIDHCDVCARHARIATISDEKFLSIACQREEFCLSLPSGQDLQEIVLANGVEFYIGEVRCHFRELGVRMQIELSDEPELPQRVLPMAPPAPTRMMCPRCQEMLLRVPVSAKFCPRCGLDLPEDCPPWSSDGSVDSMNPALIAYANALFNLGLKFENVAGGWDMQQAKRYFEKAAKFGISPAKARLEAT